MLYLFFCFLCLLTTPARKAMAVARFDYRYDPLEQRVYVGDPSPIRFYLDKGDGLWCFHEEGWAAPRNLWL